MTMVEDKFAEIRRFCQENANDVQAKKYARFFVEGYDAYGLDPKLLEQEREVLLGRFRQELDFAGFLNLGDMLVASGKYEEGFFAIYFAGAFKNELTPATFDRLGQWLDNGFRNWAHIDVFSGQVLSHFVTKKIVPLQAFCGWCSSPSKWKRRAVPVTLLSALQKEIPISALLEVMAAMMSDSEKVVQQGLGWFLREAWKKFPLPVEEFLLSWKDTCGRIIVQYATEKMSAEQKARFKKIKKPSLK